MLPGVKENVRGWTFTLPSELPFCDAPPSSLLDPKRVQLCQRMEIVGTWCRSQLLTLKGGGGVRGVCWKLWDYTRKRDNYSVTRSCNKTNHKRVSSPLETPLVLGQATGNTDSLDSPQPRLRGSHHLPPYSILYVAPPHLHPNGFYSRDSQGEVPKLSRFGLPRLWELITPSSDLGLRWGLEQTYSSSKELSNGVSHSIFTHRDWVDFWPFVVESQTASLTPGPFFDHNLFCRCPNGSCEAIFDIYISRPFQRYKEHLKVRCFNLYNRTLKFRES
jgi:hypothetical protein